MHVRTNKTRRPPRIKLLCAVPRAASRPQRARTYEYPEVYIGRRREIRRGSATRGQRKENGGRQGEVSRQPRGYIALPGCPRGLTFSSAREFLHGCAPEDYEPHRAGLPFLPSIPRRCSRVRFFPVANEHGGKYVSSSIRMRKLSRVRDACIYVRCYRHHGT